MVVIIVCWRVCEMAGKMRNQPVLLTCHLVQLMYLVLCHCICKLCYQLIALLPSPPPSPCLSVQPTVQGQGHLPDYLVT